MKPYAFFLDLDRTYLSGENIPKENIEAIKESQKKGHFVFINTGRSYAGVGDKVLHSAPFDGVVAGLGTDIRIHGERVYTKRLQPETAAKLVEYYLSIPGENLYLSGENVCFVTNPDFASDIHVVIQDAEEYREKYMTEPVNKFTATVHPEKSAIEPYREELNLYYYPKLIEGTVAGCSKATGMALAAEKLGVPIERCVAIGYSANDVDVLSAAGIAVVMGNHEPGMEKYADFITDTVENAGVAKAILKLIEEN